MSKIVQDILAGVATLSVQGDVTIAITGIEFDSRKVTSGSLFVAQKGTQVDGHQFIPKVIEMGAAAVLCQDIPTELPDSVVYIQVEDSARAMGTNRVQFLR